MTGSTTPSAKYYLVMSSSCTSLDCPYEEVALQLVLLRQSSLVLVRRLWELSNEWATASKLMSESRLLCGVKGPAGWLESCPSDVDETMLRSVSFYSAVRSVPPRQRP